MFFFFPLVLSFNTLHTEKIDKHLKVELVFYKFNVKISKLLLVKSVNGLLKTEQNISSFFINHYRCDKEKKIEEEYKTPNNKTVTTLRFIVEDNFTELYILGFLEDTNLFMLKKMECIISGESINLESSDKKLEEKKHNMKLSEYTVKDWLICLGIGIPVGIILIIGSVYLSRRYK